MSLLWGYYYYFIVQLNMNIMTGMVYVLRLPDFRLQLINLLIR